MAVRFVDEARSHSLVINISLHCRRLFLSTPPCSYIRYHQKSEHRWTRCARLTVRKIRETEVFCLRAIFIYSPLFVQRACSSLSYHRQKCCTMTLVLAAGKSTPRLRSLLSCFRRFCTWSVLYAHRSSESTHRLTSLVLTLLQTILYMSPSISVHFERGRGKKSQLGDISSHCRGLFFHIFSLSTPPCSSLTRTLIRRGCTSLVSPSGMSDRDSARSIQTILYMGILVRPYTESILQAPLGSPSQFLL
jgi:hypothetical protein